MRHTTNRKEHTSVYDALVIGGGINGLSTLYHLNRLGCRRLGLVEQFRLGHSRGSSHGHSRVTRSGYQNAHYVRLMQIVHNEEWPRLERDANRTFIHPTPGCFFGPAGGIHETYARAVAGLEVEVELIEVAQARSLFPQFRFERAASVLYDKTAGVIAAADALAALVQLSRRNEVHIHTERRVLEVDPSRTPIRVETTHGPLEAERLVITAGPWASHILPFLKPRLTVARQTVGYFALSGKPEDFQVGRFPVWGNLDADRSNIYYGLPQFGSEGVKVARHVTIDADDDPDRDEEIPGEAINDLKSLLERELFTSVKGFISAETCLYTNTASEDFIIDLHPEYPHIAIGAGFSGHGFKFGPLTGRVLAELVLHGKTGIPEFEEARSMFATAVSAKQP